MKKITLVILLLASIALFRPVIDVSAATTSSAATVQGSVAVTPTPATTTAVIQYDLPYPGLLPDNPLYFIKQIRDWILEKLILDPAKKTEFYILQGDKRLEMGVLLDASGKGVLGEQVISKGEKYMNNAVMELFAAKSKGLDIPGYVVDHVTLSLSKHAEVVAAEIAKAVEPQKSGLTGSLNLITQLQADLAKLK